MTKWISVLVSGVIGSILAVVAAYGVIHSSTSAPSSNPAAHVVVNYGTK